MHRLACMIVALSTVVATKSLLAADDLDHPFLPKQTAVVTIDEKTKVTALEIFVPTFAREQKGSKLEVNTAYGWGWVDRNQMMTREEAKKFLPAHNKEAYGLYLQSVLHHMDGQLDKAMADLNGAIKIDSKFCPAYYARGSVHVDKKEHEKALADFQEAVKVDPKNMMAAHELAWFRATCPNAKFRDGKEAVAEATRACEATGYKQEDFLDTLGAAYAEAGDFKSALKWTGKAMEIDPMNEDFEKHIKLFKAKKAVRDED